MFAAKFNRSVGLAAFSETQRDARLGKRSRSLEIAVKVSGVARGVSEARDTFFMATEADCHGASSGTPILHLYQVPNAQLASEMRQMVERREPD